MAATTVSDLVLNFAEACRALVPALDHAGVPWREGQSYDNWDRIAEPLFASLVTEPCAIDAVGEAELGRLKIARYDFATVGPDCKAYVALDGAVPKRMIGLSTVAEPFDHVTLEGEGRTERVPLATARFVFIFEAQDGTQQQLASVNLAAE